MDGGLAGLAEGKRSYVGYGRSLLGGSNTQSVGVAAPADCPV